MVNSDIAVRLVAADTLDKFAKREALIAQYGQPTLVFRRNALEASNKMLNAPEPVQK